MTREEALKVWRDSVGFNEVECSSKLQEAISVAFREMEKDSKLGCWVPVSKGLPKKNMKCLVSAGEFNFTQMAIYSDLMGTISHKIFYQGVYGKNSFKDITQYVKAWMPLPEDYKPEKNEIYCTECPYFIETIYTGEEWHGAYCKNDGHSTEPSMYAIKSLHNNCPLIEESEE